MITCRSCSRFEVRGARRPKWLASPQTRGGRSILALCTCVFALAPAWSSWYALVLHSQTKSPCPKPVQRRDLIVPAVSLIGTSVALPQVAAAEATDASIALPQVAAAKATDASSTAAPADPATKIQKTPLQVRLTEEDLEKLGSGYIPEWGPSDIYYPEWMEGTWQVTQTLEKFVAPLGVKFIGGTGRGDFADKAVAEMKSNLGIKVSFRLKYVKTKRGNIVEDRLYNVRARCDGFAGKKVVREVTYSDVPSFGRQDQIKRGDGPNDPLLTTVVQFNGATEKNFITAFQTEVGEDGKLFRALASLRTFFGRGSQDPIVVDEEAVTVLRRQPDGSIFGRLRLCGFLNAKDNLFFDAGNKAVSIADYGLRFSRVSDTDDVVDPTGIVRPKGTAL